MEEPQYAGKLVKYKLKMKLLPYCCFNSNDVTCQIINKFRIKPDLGAHMFGHKYDICLERSHCVSASCDEHRTSRNSQHRFQSVIQSAATLRAASA